MRSLVKIYSHEIMSINYYIIFNVILLLKSHYEDLLSPMSKANDIKDGKKKGLWPANISLNSDSFDLALLTPT